ncbi:MAG: type II secretion system protein GspD [Cyanobium sp.]
MALLAITLPGLPLASSAQTTPPYSQPGTTVQVPIGGSMELKVRRLPDAVEVTVKGVGAKPQLQQSTRGPAWEGLLFTARPNSLRRGPQRVGLPEAGLANISLDGAGNGYRIVVTPVQGAAVPRPVVSADGRDLILSFAVPTNPQLQTATPSLTTPGRVPEASFVPPLQPRAVAPPVGDIAVGTMMLANTSFLNVSGPPVTMTLRNAPARDALMALAQMGGYGFVYVDESATGAAGAATATATGSGRPISLSFRNESYSRAINSALLAAGLQGKRDGNMILAGPNVLNKTFGATMSKVFRLNQVSASAAADYLANLGATVTKVNTITTAVTQGADQNNAIAGAPNAATTQSSTTTNIETYGAALGPLKGLLGTTDSRLGTITLVGDPRVVAIAEGYLRQLDLRQRQVALTVKILDVTLDNDTSIDNSFAFRYGNNFIVNDRGEMLGAFGGLLPPRGEQFNALSGGASSAKPVTGESQDTIPPLSPAPVNPGVAYPRDNFFNLLQASILSRNTKVLASPTLILTDNPAQLREGSDQSLITQGLGSGGRSGNSSGTIGRSRANEAFVTVGEQVVTNWTVTAGQNGAPNSCQAELSTAGLTFGARVQKIDDNGFVTFSITPTITAPTRTEPVPQCGNIEILSIRSLDSGSARVRDGQTLIMTGVLSDLDNQTVQKWPILGDLPLVGQFFRSTTGLRRKRELVILVTPRILRDDQGGAYGYGYQPSTPDARSFLRQAGG